MLGDERADQAVTWLDPLTTSGLDQEVARLRHRAEHAESALPDVEAGMAQLTEVVAVLRCHPEELADHLERDREREVGHEIDGRTGVALGLEGIEALRHDRVDPGLQPGQPASGELGGEQATKPGVVRGIGESESSDGLRPGRVLLADVLADVGAEAFGVGEHGAVLGHTRHHPHTQTEDRRQQVDRTRLAGASQLVDRVQPVALQGELQRPRHLLQRRQVDRAQSPPREQAPGSPSDRAQSPHA